MKDKKHLDRIFQERLKDFEETPDPKVWGSIQNTLHKKDRDRKVIPLWWKISGIAAGFLLLISLGTFLLDNNSNTEQPAIQITESEIINTSEIEDTVTNVKKDITITAIDTLQSEKNENNSGLPSRQTLAKEEVASQLTSESNDKNSKSKIARSDAKKLISKSEENTNLAINENIRLATENNQNEATDPSDLNSNPFSKSNNLTEQVAKTEISIEENTAEDNSTNELDKNTTSDLINIEEALAESETTNEKEKPRIDRWAISPNVAPVYFNSLGKGSPIHPQFIDNTKAGDVEMSYGVTGSYSINEKLKIRLGVNNVNLGYTTGDVIVYEDINAFVGNDDINGNIAMERSSNNTSFLSATSINTAEAPDVFISNEKGSIDQEFGFIEIPLELEYNLFQSKFGVNVIGGFSTFFLSKNEVYTDISNIRQYVGEATNLNNTSYSANIGLGINYNLSKLLDINLEPIFKYQFNTFTNTSGNFKPYIFGVYSGVRFKF
ncbi:hypothetical protein [Aegicerativicinus sediminis]|uniref:hypothetical protein n=1 Tax=Aegicerativicinus sediminis TaxID=2893202 RepID=UPI001E38637B|nr:hypothetical protein [Aegicerativicinus sediminis]